MPHSPAISPSQDSPIFGGTTQGVALNTSGFQPFHVVITAKEQWH